MDEDRGGGLTMLLFLVSARDVAFWVSRIERPTCRASRGETGRSLVVCLRSVDALSISGRKMGFVKIWLAAAGVVSDQGWALVSSVCRCQASVCLPVSHVPQPVVSSRLGSVTG